MSLWYPGCQCHLINGFGEGSQKPKFQEAVKNANNVPCIRSHSEIIWDSKKFCLKE
ncbi:hypothetical protein CRE_17616 [Caenorhabditis remanei]|uniref:Uncharacterized protein n=1 Tax=Caenorhabditis remanei TaxID=31234 RepID=E3NHB4_CAERE|nr:hypothetical protein CRE_17616 [Caenorhabditis remanei]